jgi:hypothetical protein
MIKKAGIQYSLCELPHQTFLHTQEAGANITLGLIYAQEHQNI